MNKKKKFSIVLIHILVWAMLFALPYLLSNRNDTPELERTIQQTWIPLVMYAVVFYTNYLFLIEKFFLKRKFVLYFGINVLLIALFIWLKHTVVMELFRNGEEMRPNLQRMPPPRNFFIYLDTLSFILPLIFSIALKTGERWLKMEAEKKEMETTKLQSELQHLKYQLQPHFFFNSLNNIYSLVDISPEKAKETIHALGKLMRYLLYESNTEKVELNKEIEFLEKYIELMKLRSSGNVTVTSDFPKVLSSVKIAPLLYISLIENAFKHGVSATEKSKLNFWLKVENGIVSFHSKNTNFLKSNSDKSGSGIGLENLKKRLSLIYPDKHTLEIKNTPEEYEVRLDIQLS